MLKRLTFVSLVGFSCTLYGASDREDVGKITVEDDSEVVALTHSPIPVSVIDMEKFHGRNISLNEILKRVAGVKVMQQGGLGSKSIIAIHGLEGKRVKIFIDGRPLNSPDGTFGINDIPVQLIDRVEVYKGVVPAKFGGDALGGAVNVVTREFDGSYIDMTYSGSTYDTHRGTLVVKKKFEDHNIELGMGGFYNQAANDYVMKSPYFEGLNIKRDHDRYESFAAAVGLTINERWFDEISFELVRYESEKEIQGVEKAIKEAKTKSRVNMFGSQFKKSDFFVDGLEFEYTFTYIDLLSNYIDKAQTCYNFDGSTRPCPGNGGEINGVPHDSADKQEDFRHDVNLHYLINGNHGVNFHLNMQDSTFEPSDPLASQSLGYDIGAFPSEKRNTVYSLGLDSSFFNGKLVNDAGIKSYHYDYDITSQVRTVTGSPAQTKNDGSEFGYYESIRYEPIKDLFIKASYEHAYRLPNSEEIFGDGVTVTSAPNLTPEEADNFNLGFLYDTNDFYGLPWLKAEANFFYRDLQNMIKLEHAFLTSGYVNLGEVAVKGFEVELQADLNDNWYLYANYTNQSLKDKQKILKGTLSTPNPTYNRDLPNVAKQYGNIGVEYKTLGLFRTDSMFKLFWESNWADEYYYGWELSRYQDRKIDEQFTHTAGFEYSFKDDHYILGLEVRNLTDEEITDVFNYPLMGRTFHLNLRYTWFEN
ncbi:MAG: TonB-dependent receptor [Epsilonproteobacteria bacterium]|nr:TonB-dependent receptor [Campylobacterota bacterium]